jgi:phage I-like protein
MPALATSTATATVELMSQTNGGDQWIHLLPAGTIQTRDYRGPWKLTNPSAVIQASREAAGRLKMPIDYDHAIDLATPNGAPAPAAGWIDALQSRADGIWGRVEWTPRAAQQLLHREYRYLSPVLELADDRRTVTSILRASLTNIPNLPQLVALASMETATMDELLQKLRAALSLPDTATIDDILAAVSARTTERAAAVLDPSQFVPIGDFERVVTEVHRLNQGISLQAATAHVKDHIERGNLLPYLNDWAVQLCSVNKPAFDKFVEKTKGSLALLRTPLVPGGAPPADRETRTALSQDELAIASNLGVSADAFLKTKSARGTAQE